MLVGGNSLETKCLPLPWPSSYSPWGLSFLGVWEIPIPGFVGGGAANELAAKEGPAGAFFKGAITTILATPCSGPGIAIALGYCTGKPIGFVYLIFTMLGLGMASPYLIIGANPKLIRFLPKPGMWMETFKQIMGFVLMATVIYLLSFINWANILPTLTLLLGSRNYKLTNPGVFEEYVMITAGRIAWPVSIYMWG